MVADWHCKAVFPLDVRRAATSFRLPASGFRLSGSS